jgi:hypothetical protein
MEKVIYALQSKGIIKAINKKEAHKIIDLATKYDMNASLTILNEKYFVVLNERFKVKFFK